MSILNVITALSDKITHSQVVNVVAQDQIKIGDTVYTIDGTEITHAPSAYLAENGEFTDLVYGCTLGFAKSDANVGENVTVRTIGEFMMGEKVEIPTYSGSLTYNGNAQSPNWIGYDSNCIDISGTVSAIDVGYYITTFTPKRGYCWSDGSVTPKYVEWSIAQAASQAFAVYSAAADGGDGSLTFYKNADFSTIRDAINAGETYSYHDKPVTNIYSGFEKSVFARYSDVPWSGVMASVKSVYFADKISPTGTAYWFYTIDDYSTRNLATVDLTNLDTSNVTNMKYMFHYCSSLTTLTLPEGFGQVATDMSYMFYYCSGLTNLTLPDGFGQAATNMSKMFYCCTGLTSLTLPEGFGSAATDMSNMFYSCDSLTNLILPEGFGSAVTNTSRMFSYCTALTNLTLPNGFGQVATEMFDTFNCCTGLTSLILPDGFGQAATNMSNMFYWCNPTSLTLPEGFGQAATDMSYMFYGSSGLQSLTLPNGFGQVATNMYNMFYGSSGLQSLTLPSGFGKDATNMNSMFQDCTALTSLTLPSRFGQVATNMSYIFRSCSSLTTLTLPEGFGQAATDMSYMFYYCSGLTSLTLPDGFGKVLTNTSNMFNGCRSLTTINVSDSWTNTNITSSDSMFSSCPNLVGGNGTPYNSSNIDATFAVIDTDSTPGYFTHGTLPGLKLISRPNKDFYIAGESFDLNGMVISFTDTDGNESVLTNSQYTITPSRELTSTDNMVVISYSTSGKIYTLDVFFTVCEPTEPVAILYSDGTMVFQLANTAIDLEHGPVTKIYTGFNSETYISTAQVPWNKQWRSITSVSFADEIKPVSTAYWFYGCANLTSVENIANLDTSSVADMSHMFVNCRGLTSLTLPEGFGQAATNMNSMFYGSSGLTSLTLPDGFGQMAMNMDSMFRDCSNLTSLTLPSHFGQVVTNMFWMFANCSSLTSLTLPDGFGQAATDMFRLFNNCSGLTSLTLSNGFGQSATSMTYMFYGCSGLTSLTLPDGFGQSATNMSYMFYNCSGLTSLDLSGWDTSKVNNMSYMFYGCKGLKSLDLSTTDTRSMTSPGCLYYFAYECASLTELTFGENFGQVRNISVPSTAKIFYVSNALLTSVSGANDVMKDYNWKMDNRLLEGSGETSYAVFSADDNSLTFYHNMDASTILTALSAGEAYTYNDKTVTNLFLFDEGTNITSESNISWSKVASNIEKVRFADKISPTSTAYWFYGMSNLTDIDFTNLDTSNVTDMSYMFRSCSGLTSLILPADFGQSAINISSMFNSCSGLTSLTLPDGFGQSATNTYYMFYNCNRLPTLVLPDGFGQAATNMNSMFYKCSGLQSLTLPEGFGQSATDMSYMFQNCSNLKSLTLPEGFGQSATDMSYMFASCSGLITIYVYDSWSVESVTFSSSMFYGCTKLVGGSGTKYSSGYTDKSYAHIDKADQKGYLTGVNQERVLAIYSADDNSLTFYKRKGLVTEGVVFEGKTATNVYIVSIVSPYTSETSVPWYNIRGSIKNVSFADEISPAGTAYWFCGMSNLTDIVFTNLDTSNVTDMRNMFRNCSGLTSLDLSNFDTSKATIMSGLFLSCTGLQNLTLPEGFGQSATNMSSMFYSCNGLTNLTLPDGFGQSATNMNSMFASCSGLTSLTLSDGFGQSATTMEGTFQNCSNLVTIYVYDSWSVESVTSSRSYRMFYGCIKLVGGNGTKYSSSYTNKSYACIDKEGQKGYLTDIAEKPAA